MIRVGIFHVHKFLTNATTRQMQPLLTPQDRQLDSILNPYHYHHGSLWTTTSPSSPPFNDSSPPTSPFHYTTVTPSVSPGLDDDWRLPGPAIQLDNPPRQDDVDIFICWGSSVTSNVDVIQVSPSDFSMTFTASPFDLLVETTDTDAQTARAAQLLSCVNDLTNVIFGDDNMDEDPSTTECKPNPTFQPNKTYKSSDIIPIPKTHNISPKPDEGDMVKRAKYDDAKMYALVVGGMLEQMKRDQSTNGVVHPMSAKSLRSVLRTSQTKYEELDCLKVQQYGEQDDCSSILSESSWEVSYIEEDNTIDSMISSYSQLLLTHHDVPCKLDSDGSMFTSESTMCLRDDESDEDEDDDCVFYLEL